MADHPDEIIARLAQHQHNRVTRGQLLELGLTTWQIRRRLRTGHLHRVLGGVYAVGSPAGSTRAGQMASVLAAGLESALTHVSGAALWELLPQDAPPYHVTRPSGSARVAGVRVHRALLPPEEVTIRDGLRVTTVARTLLDLAASEPEAVLVRALGEAEVRGLITRPELMGHMTRWSGRRGLRRLREVLADDLEPAPTRSALEDLFTTVVRAAALPRPVRNRTVAGVEVDAFWARHRVAVELDGRSFHDTPTRFEGDRARDARLAAAGILTLRFTWRRLKSEPLAVAAELSAALALREAA